MVTVELYDDTDFAKNNALAGVAVKGSDPRSERHDETVEAIIWHCGLASAVDVDKVASCRPRARILLVSSGGPTVDRVEEIRPDLPEELRDRVYGSACRDSLHALADKQFFQKLVAFLTSDDQLPQDARVASFLGLDFPVRRLAIRVALEIAREELSRPEPELEVQALLEPALKIAQGVARLEQVVAPVRTVLQGTSGDVKGAVEQALKQLAGAEVQELRS